MRTRIVGLVAAASCVTATVAAAAPAAATGIVCLNQAGTKTVVKVKPGSCADFGPGGSFGGGVNLAQLHWSGWGSASATAHGIELGFHLPASRIPVAVVAFRKRPGCNGGQRYTRLRVSSSYGTTTVRLPTCAGAATARAVSAATQSG
jgi:hypothetical protein